MTETGIFPLLSLIFFPQMEYLVIYQSPPPPSFVSSSSFFNDLCFTHSRQGCTESPSLSRCTIPQRSALSAQCQPISPPGNQQRNRSGGGRRAPRSPPFPGCQPALLPPSSASPWLGLAFPIGKRRLSFPPLPGRGSLRAGAERVFPLPGGRGAVPSRPPPAGGAGEAGEPRRLSSDRLSSAQLGSARLRRPVRPGSEAAVPLPGKRLRTGNFAAGHCPPACHGNRLGSILFLRLFIPVRTTRSLKGHYAVRC